MQITFAIVTAGVWQSAERPEIQVRKMERTRLGRNGFALAGWAVFVNGIELPTAGRNRTMRDAAAAAESYVNRQAEIEDRARLARLEAEAARQLAVNSPEGQAARTSPPAPIREALDRVSIAAREAVEAAIAAAEDRPAEPDPCTEDDVDELIDRIMRRAQYQALRGFLLVLDEWVDGARSNDKATGRAAVFGEHDVTFVRDDIRNMVTDTAAELSVPDPVVLAEATS